MTCVLSVRDRRAEIVIHPTATHTGPTRLAPRVTNTGRPRKRFTKAGEDLGGAIQIDSFSSEIGCGEAMAEAVPFPADPGTGGTGGREIDARITKDHDQ